MRAALDQDAAEAAIRKRRQYRSRCDFAAGRRHFNDFDAVSKRRFYPLGGDHKSPDTVVGQNLGAGRQPPFWIEHDACRTWAGDAPDRELRIVGDCRADADQYRIDERTELVEMIQARRTVDVFGMSGDCRDTAIDRLSNLTDNNEIIDRAVAQRAKPFFPRRRKGGGGGAKLAWNFLPTVAVVTTVSGTVCIGHVFAHRYTCKWRIRLSNTMVFED